MQIKHHIETLDSAGDRTKFRPIHAGVLDLCKSYLAIETIKKKEDTTDITFKINYSVGNHEFADLFPSVEESRPQKKKKAGSIDSKI